MLHLCEGLSVMTVALRSLGRHGREVSPQQEVRGERIRAWGEAEPPGEYKAGATEER